MAAKFAKTEANGATVKAFTHFSRMARYFFHIFNDITVHDDEGLTASTQRQTLSVLLALPDSGHSFIRSLPRGGAVRIEKTETKRSSLSDLPNGESYHTADILLFFAEKAGVRLPPAPACPDPSDKCSNKPEF